MNNTNKYYNVTNLNETFHNSYSFNFNGFSPFDLNRFVSQKNTNRWQKWCADFFSKATTTTTTTALSFNHK